MVRRVFYSFHYAADAWRTSQVREIGALENEKRAHDNSWESVRRGGERAIQNWIDTQLNGRSCTVVLIGKDTAGRKWIDYEIEKSWNNGKGLVGIHIHRLKDANGEQTAKGNNPFDHFTINGDRTALSSIVKVYDPPFSGSKLVYNCISQKMSEWIEEAIQIRSRY